MRANGQYIDVCVYMCILIFTYIPNRYGMLLRKKELNDQATTILLSSLKKYEYNWSAWMELGALVTSKKQVIIDPFTYICNQGKTKQKS